MTALPEDLRKLFAHVDGNKDRYIDVLREAVSIKSVTAWPENRSEIQRMVRESRKGDEEHHQEILSCR